GSRGRFRQRARLVRRSQMRPQLSHGKAVYGLDQGPLVVARLESVHRRLLGIASDGWPRQRRHWLDSLTVRSSPAMGELGTAPRTTATMGPSTNLAWASAPSAGAPCRPVDDCGS